MVRKKSIGIYTGGFTVRRPLSTLRSFTSRLLAFVSIFGSLGWAQQPAPDWQAEVQKYAQAQDWSGAMRIVDREIARAPHDMDVRAWRARVLAWSDIWPKPNANTARLLPLPRTTRITGWDWRE